MQAQALPQPAQVISPPPTAPPARVHRQHRAGLDVIVVESARGSELHLTLLPREGETPAALVGRLATVLGECDATMVRQIAFGAITAYEPTLAALRQTFRQAAFPLTWVAGNSCANHPIAGLQVHAVTGTPVRTESAADGSVVCVWADAVATHCVLSALGTKSLGASRPRRAAPTLEQLQAGLAGAGMTMKDIARTWFFLDDILSWYADFNHERNDFYARCELPVTIAPASTGVSGRNPAGSALTAAAWAVKAHDGAGAPVQVVPSPQQGPAPAYGSAFSRAVEIHSAGFRQLLVSGTASIAPNGDTAHGGDVRRQIELTMQVAGAILESRQMSFADVSRATAYFKAPAAVAVWKDWCVRNEQQTLPVVCVGGDICRDDLLFEIELDAIRANPLPAAGGNGAD